MMPPSGLRKTLEATAPGGIAVQDLGRLYDEDLRPLDGPNGAPLFKGKSPLVVVVNSIDHQLFKVTTSSQFNASISYFVASGRLQHKEENRYIVYRALDVTQVVRFDDSGLMRTPPARAAFYLAEIHFGHSYESIIFGSSFELTAGAEARIGRLGGSIGGFVKNERLEERHRGLGLTPKHAGAIFAMSGDEIQAGYGASGPAVPVLVKFRQVPGAQLPGEREIKWVDPLFDDRRVLEDGASLTWNRLSPGKYKIRVTAGPDAIRISWSDPSCDRGDFIEYSTECVLRAPSSLTIENPTTFGLGSSVVASIRISKIGK